METKTIDLYEFLVESELQHYYNSIKNELKITNVSHLKYASDEDLKQIGLSRPEIRRLRKFYEKYFHHGYLSKIKRLLQPPTIIRKEENTNGNSQNAINNLQEQDKLINSPNKSISNKHIIPADQICVNKQLGSGEFGIVQQGVWTNGTERIQVAIKCLCRERMQSNPMEFLKEAAIMHAIENENIVRLYGVVLDTDSLMLVTELAHLRSLLECLKDPGLRVSFLTVPTLCEFAIQICNGMMYLENKRLIHRDLAARNILVFSKNKIKISDFGLSRALGVGKDYYKTNFNVNLKLPIAWCAPECINYLRFTNASDVWAYGVCLWEMFSYGFQPWPALTGLQILSAIDEPNYQRLEQPECCPRDYYNLMLKCWQHDPLKRPKFNEIYSNLPDMKPEQLKTIVNNLDAKKDYLIYRQGEIITVLDKNCNNSLWKGVLNSGKTGLFNPANTVAHLEGLPSSINPRDSFYRSTERGSKKKLRTEMISMPQNDLKHTGHVGLDGAYFGDVAFLNNSQNCNNHLPRQIVTPYKPSEDIEQTPLLLPTTPTSPDSLQTASGYFPEENASSTNPTFINSNENTPKHNSNFGSTFNFPPTTNNIITGLKNANPIFNSSNPFANEALNENSKIHNLEINAFTNVSLEDDQGSSKLNKKMWLNTKLTNATNDSLEPHEYHEISDDEITTEKVFDMGPSLLDEINSMFGTINSSTINDDGSPKSPDLDYSKRHDFSDFTSKLIRKNSNDTNGNKSKKKNCIGQVKQISIKDEKILNHAIEIANEISARSMTDLVSDHNHHQHAQSPKRKFSFRFPHLNHHPTEKEISANQIKERKNFSEELQSIPDLQNIITNEGREAYNSLIEKKSTTKNLANKNNSFGLNSAQTLPRNLLTSSQLSNFDIALKRNQQDSLVDTELFCTMTLPTRSQKLRNVDSNPLRILRDKNFTTIKSRPKTLISDEDNVDSFKSNFNGEHGNLDCESPSYLTNLTSYNFPQVGNNNFNNNDINYTNSIPLPPRDRSKKSLAQPKRHVRKHPLIIPGYGVQRTLNKVTEITPVDEKPNLKFPDSFNESDNLNYSKDNEENINDQKIKKVTQQIVSTYDNQKCIRSNGDLQLKYEYTLNNNTYENINKITDTDTASLQFESILEDNFNKGDILSSPDVIDGFDFFEIQKDQYQKSKEINFHNSNISHLYDKEDELRNLDIEKKNIDDFIKSSNVNCSKNIIKNNIQDELSNNELFNKIKENINLSMQKKNIEQIELKDEEKKILHLQNSVSCEDLLEFSDIKPKGCERGVDSDEVRIMSKVLGKDISLQNCLTALEFIKWDVHKAIKLIKLQNIMKPLNLNFTELVNGLQKYEWDLQTAVFKLKGLK